MASSGSNLKCIRRWQLIQLHSVWVPSKLGSVAGACRTSRKLFVTPCRELIRFSMATVSSQVCGVRAAQGNANVDVAGPDVVVSKLKLCWLGSMDSM
jgi:hypothetical protein